MEEALDSNMASRTDSPRTPFPLGVHLAWEGDDSADLASEAEALADLALEAADLEVEALLSRYWQEQLEAFCSETYSMDLTMVEGTVAEDLMAEDLMVEDSMEALTEPSNRKNVCS